MRKLQAMIVGAVLGLGLLVGPAAANHFLGHNIGVLDSNIANLAAGYNPFNPFFTQATPFFTSQILQDPRVGFLGARGLQLLANQAGVGNLIAPIFTSPFANPFSRSVQAGVNQYLTGGGCVFGGLCSSLGAAEQLFPVGAALNPGGVGALREHCIRIHGPANCNF